MSEADVYCPPGMPLPNVAHDRAHGITALAVYCEGLYCAHSRRFTLDELQLTDDMIMIPHPALPPLGVHAMRKPEGSDPI